MASLRLEDMSLKQLGETPHSDMEASQKEALIVMCKQAFDQFERSTEKGKEEKEASIISRHLKNALDAAYGPNWFVVVGQSYVSYFPYEAKTYWHFCFRKNYVTCFKLP